MNVSFEQMCLDVEVYTVACCICFRQPTYHAMFCQLSDIGQDELVFQDPLHMALTQSVAWNTIRSGVLTHLRNAALPCCHAVLLMEQSGSQ